MGPRPRSGGEGTGANPTDRGKKGTKRSLLTDGAGIPISLVVDGANRHDMKLVESTLHSIVTQRPEVTPDAPLMHLSTWVWIKGTTMSRYESWRFSMDTLLTFELVEGSILRSNRFLVIVSGVG